MSQSQTICPRNSRHPVIEQAVGGRVIVRCSLCDELDDGRADITSDAEPQRDDDDASLG